MSLMNHCIVEQVQTEMGFPKTQSIEIVESLLEIIKAMGCLAISAVP